MTLGPRNSKALSAYKRFLLFPFPFAIGLGKHSALLEVENAKTMRSVIKNHSLNVSINRKHYYYFWRHILSIILSGGTFPSGCSNNARSMSPPPFSLQGIFGMPGFPVTIKELQKQAWDGKYAFCRSV